MTLLDLYTRLATPEAAQGLSAAQRDALASIPSPCLPFGPPAPQGGFGDVWLEILESLEIPPALRRELEGRRALGVVKYGRPVQHGDGRGVQDFREELMDALVYARRDGLSEEVQNDLLRLLSAHPRPPEMDLLPLPAFVGHAALPSGATKSTSLDWATASGEEVHLLRPERTRIRIYTDLVQHLFRETRYAGGVPWSVGSHSLLCADIAMLLGLSAHEVRLAALHDAPEAYLKDLPGKMHSRTMIHAGVVQGIVHVVPFKEVHQAWDRHIKQSLNVPTPWDFDRMARIDRMALHVEMIAFKHQGYKFLPEETWTPEETFVMTSVTNALRRPYLPHAPLEGPQAKRRWLSLVQGFPWQVWEGAEEVD